MSEFVMRTSAKSRSSSKYGAPRISIASTVDPNSKRELDRRLDQALEETFPASDPVSIVISRPSE